MKEEIRNRIESDLLDNKTRQENSDFAILKCDLDNYIEALKELMNSLNLWKLTLNLFLNNIRDVSVFQNNNYLAVLQNRF